MIPGVANQNENLCRALMEADSEAEVIELLKASGYWQYSKNWRWLGDEEFNYSSVGNQQSRAEQAVIEKLINAIDAKLMAEARIEGDLPLVSHSPQAEGTPQSINQARTKYFGNEIADLDQLSRGITVAATGAKPKEGRPCFTIVDNGEGQTPARMPSTILSLHKGYKDKIKFAQGKFNMGGTGVLEFCGVENNVQLIVSRRHPQLVPPDSSDSNDRHWSFTVIRREDPTEGKSSRFSYLAPLGSDERPREGTLLTFDTENLPIFPEKNRAYARNAAWGTLIKLYEYDARRFATNMMQRDGFMYRARLLLPEPALPIRFYECRDYRGDPARSFDTTMPGLIETLQRDFDNERRDNVEWFDRVPFDVEGERFTARIYLFKNKAAADAYRRDEGVVFTYNGQCHGVMTKDFFRRKKVKQDYLWHSLLVFVDCSEISIRGHERLFMNSRDRLRDGQLKARLENDLEDLFRDHQELKLKANERRKRDLSEKPKAAESMVKVIQSLLSKNPTLASLLGQGLRIKNPHKPEVAATGTGSFVGRRFPTKFHFKGKQAGVVLEREAFLESNVKITFETDAADDYFRRTDERGEFSLYEVDGDELYGASNYRTPRLFQGLAHLSLWLPEGAVAGRRLTFEAVVNDPSRIDPIRNRFVLEVRPAREARKGKPGTRRSSGGDDGAYKVPKKGGETDSHESMLDIPEPRPIYESDWPNQEPPFDRFTALRIMSRPDVEDGEEKYDYLINMDNVYLQTYLRENPKAAEQIKLRFSVGMTLVALAILHQDHFRNSKAARMSEDMPNGDVDIHDRVSQTTAALAPFLLPMVESVGEISGEEEALSESAGEAA